MLIKEGEVCTFTAWAKEHKLPQTGNILDEAGRAADHILEKFPRILS